MNLKLIIHEILEDYALPLHGDHGVSHWARVLENGLRLSTLTEANVTVVSLFAVFHDSRRINECTDAHHGLRGADFAAEVRGRLFDVSDHEFNLLYRACEGHTHERTHPDITIQTCWDSDRLDLGRVGITPHPSKLCTDVAKTKEMIQRADGRAILAALIHGEDRDEVLSPDWKPLQQLNNIKPLHPLIQEIAQGSFRQKQPPAIQGSGWVVKSLEASLWAFHDAESFEDAVLKAVNLGDDADTTGAICGQLAGALWGESGISESLRSGLAKMEMLEIAMAGLLTKQDSP